MEIWRFTGFSPDWLSTSRTSLRTSWKLNDWPVVRNEKSTRPVTRSSLLMSSTVPLNVTPLPKSHVPVPSASSRTMPPASVVRLTLVVWTDHDVTAHSPTTHRSTVEALGAVDAGGPDGAAAATAGAGELFRVLLPACEPPAFERIRTTATVPATRTTTITVTINRDAVSGARGPGGGGGGGS